MQNSMSEAKSGAANSTLQTSLYHKFGVALRGISPFGRRHRALLLQGSLATIIVVAVRLALPWPLRAVTGIVSDIDVSTELTASASDQVLRLSLLFFVCIAVLGLFDYLARLLFSRFSIATTRDLRQAAFSATLGIDVESRKAATGDLVSRLIGDAGRVKAGMQGFLLHVATNGLLFVGVTVILFLIQPQIGMIFALASVATGLITIWGAHYIFRMSLQHRRKEGQLANKIHTSLSKSHSKSKLKRINKTSGRYEASLTRMQGRITWAAHMIFGLTIVASIWTGVHAVSAGSISVGDLVLFMFYALMIRGPIVRLSRQGTRTGKILGPAYRLVQMLEPAATEEGAAPALRLRSLKKRMTLKRVSASSSSTEGGPTANLGPIDLSFDRGERIAIVDHSGISLRPLLEIIAGRRGVGGGSVLWDSASLKGANIRALHNQVALITPDPLTSESMSPLAQRFQQIAVAARRRASVWLFLEPAEGLSPEDTEQVMSSLSANESGRAPTTIVATCHEYGLESYDRIIHVKDGRVVFDGNNEDWRGMQKSTATVTAMPLKTEPREPESTLKILFAGYAPVHFRCFQPLYQRLQNRPDVEVFVSGGLRSGAKGNYNYDAAAMYDGFGLPPGTVLSVEEIRDMDFDVQFSAHTKLILPRRVEKRIQIFHGVSFRNKAVRPENMGCDHYFVVGPYMLSRFEQAGLFQKDDPRITRVGFMKTDALVDGSLDKASILESVGFDGSRPVVLYAPTGAKRNSLEIMGEDAIRNLLAADDYDLLIKPHDHPKNKDVDWATYLSKYDGEHCRIIPPRDDVIPMLFAADLLISDASSVVNEYSLLDRPIVFLDTPDLLKQAREANHSMLDLDTWGRDGGLVAESADDVANRVAESLANPTKLSAERRKIAENLFFNPGQATATAMAWMEEHVLRTAGSIKESSNASV